MRELDEARTIWEELGVRSYTVVQARSCECLPPYEYMLIVEDGELVDAVYERRPNWTAVTEQFMTVDDVFDRLERVRHEEPATWTASYHPEYGYPTDVFIDGHPTVVDDEFTITMSDLVVTH